MICPSHIPELLELKLTDEGLLVGASVTLTALQEYCTDLMDKLPSDKVGFIQALLDMLYWFAGQQIRNVSVS